MTTDVHISIRRGRLIWIAVLAPLGVASALSLARDSVSAATAVLVLVLVVLAVAAAGDRVAGLVATGGAGLWFDFFLTEPYQTFTINDPDDLEAAVLLVVIGAAATEIALWGRRQAARASRDAGYLDGVFETAAMAKDCGAARQDLASAVAVRIVQVLGASACRYHEGDLLDPRIPVLGADGQVRLAGHTLPVDQDGLPTTVETAIISGAPGYGHFLVSSGDRVVRPSVAQRRLVAHLAEQLTRSDQVPSF
jgi:hypothetical protein